MYELIYSSAAVTALDEDELQRLLGVSRRYNEANAITGMLLHVHDESGESAFFVQLLEGPQAAVERTYERIAQDELHSDIEVLSTRENPERVFGDWTMRLEEISTPRLQRAGADASPADAVLLPVAAMVRDADIMAAVILRHADRLPGT